MQRQAECFEQRGLLCGIIQRESDVALRTVESSEERNLGAAAALWFFRGRTYISFLGVVTDSPVGSEYFLFAGIVSEEGYPPFGHLCRYGFLLSSWGHTCTAARLSFLLQSGGANGELHVFALEDEGGCPRGGTSSAPAMLRLVSLGSLQPR